jgi:hypothetical protein
MNFTLTFWSVRWPCQYVKNMHVQNFLWTILQNTYQHINITKNHWALKITKIFFLPHASPGVKTIRGKAWAKSGRWKHHAEESIAHICVCDLSSFVKEKFPFGKHQHGRKVQLKERTCLRRASRSAGTTQSLLTVSTLASNEARWQWAPPALRPDPLPPAPAASTSTHSLCAKGILSDNEYAQPGCECARAYYELLFSRKGVCIICERGGRCTCVSSWGADTQRLKVALLFCVDLWQILELHSNLRHYYNLHWNLRSNGLKGVDWWTSSSYFWNIAWNLPWNENFAHRRTNLECKNYAYHIIDGDNTKFPSITSHIDKQDIVLLKSDQKKSMF